MKSINFSAVLAVLIAGSNSAYGFAPSARPSHAAARKSSLSMSSALIVQNKGGGHGELGFQLAKTLQNNDKITSITILQDEKCNEEQEPFKSYLTDIPDVTIIRADLSLEMDSVQLQGMLGGRDEAFDYVWDNASKKPEGCAKALVDLAKTWDTKLYTYVSSAGMYNPSATCTFPMSETTPIKESAGQNQFDNYAVDVGLPYVSFRPQYIYGPKSNKNDYIDWYFDRLVRELPLPIPADGTQKVSLTNSQDVASLLASVLDNVDAAVEQRFFNCGTDQLVTYDEVAYLCAEAAGIEKSKVMIEHYDHEKFGKAKFPFRMTDFYVSPDTAKDKLGWAGASCSLKDDLSWYYESYVARGGPEKDINFMQDWEITVGSKTSLEEGSVYDKWDSFTVDTSNVKALNVE